MKQQKGTTEKKTHNSKTKKQEEDSITINMPEVKDIPGQEKIRPPHMREMMDTTISSADEEGEGILDDLNKEDYTTDIVSDKNNNVSDLERKLLNKAGLAENEEEKDRKKLALDKTDGEDILNEDSNPENLGEDLDMPEESEQDEPGEEDEENDVYSKPD